MSRALSQHSDSAASAVAAALPPVSYGIIARDGSLAQRVVSQIEAMVFDGRLNPGDRLPSERELGRQFGVSRTVVREAVHALTARGLLSTVQGVGTVVRSPSASIVSSSLALLFTVGHEQIGYSKLIEVRKLLEVEIAGLAAARRTASDIATLESTVSAVPILEDDSDAFARNDIAFHYALACATQNELFPIFLDSIAPVLFAARVLGFSVAGTPARAQFHHRQILASVAAQDVMAARTAMQAHMAEAENTMRAALAQAGGAGRA